jgi:hypothetical protein
MNVFSRANRILRAMPSYRSLSGNDTLPIGAPKAPNLQPGENPVGFYVNNATTFSGLIFFSSENVYVFSDDGWGRVAFCEIAHVIPPVGKENVIGFNLQLKNGCLFWIPVTGKRGGRFFDAFEVIRFFDRVISDLPTNDPTGHCVMEAPDDGK